MRVYLAGPSAELERVIAAADVVRGAGHSITEPWWLRILEAKRQGWASDAEVPTEFMVESAQRNMDGMLAADCVVALCRTEGGLSSGVAYEVGLCAALASGGVPSVFVVGNPRNHVASFDEAVRVVATIGEALAAPAWAREL